TDRVVSVLLNSTPLKLASPPVISATGFAGAALAPGALATLRGTFVSGGARPPASATVPTSLGGATVRINGVAVPLLYASASQINFQVPYEIGVGSATIDLDRGFTDLTVSDVRIAAVAPAIFTISETGEGAGLLLHADGSVVSQQTPARAGETITV